MPIIMSQPDSITNMQELIGHRVEVHQMEGRERTGGQWIDLVGAVTPYPRNIDGKQYYVVIIADNIQPRTGPTLHFYGRFIYGLGSPFNVY